ncbi:MAG: hypothetical protein ACXVZV_12670 [Terriglobales bacterium]
MTLIHVPRPPKSSYDPNRPVSALLKSQIDYLHHAARRLPLRYRSEIYVNAIKTEGEAARYIREVTQAIHDAHAEAATARAKVVPKRKRVIEIAAVADERAERKRGSKKRAKKSSGKTRRKK